MYTIKKQSRWGAQGEMEIVPNFPKIFTHATIVLVIIILLAGTFGSVAAGEIGIRTRFSKVTGIVNQGLYFKIPFIEKVNILDTRTRTINYDKNGNEGDSIDSSSLTGASKDLQDVSIGVMVNYRLDAQKAENIFNQYRTNANFESNVIEPIIRETVKSVSAQYTAEELVTKRLEYSDKVSALLTERFITKDSILERFSITNFEFSKAFSAAIEAKVTAVQTAEAARNKLEQVKFEAQQTVEKAKADAQAIQIQAQAINSQGGADYVQLQAIKAWKGEVPTYMTSGASVPFINLK
jgi:regulator of protease activity HflC (stomatin/prohibitin superfamily)